jgi:hypothetical protein
MKNNPSKKLITESVQRLSKPKIKIDLEQHVPDYKVKQINVPNPVKIGEQQSSLANENLRYGSVKPRCASAFRGHRLGELF